MQEPREIVEKYLNFFNAKDWSGMLSLLHESVEHEINQGPTEVGIPKFQNFLRHMEACYDETLRDIVVFSGHPRRVAAEFDVDGVYLKTDQGLPPARHQRYLIRAGGFYEIRDQRISRIAVYYNLKSWLEHVGNS